MFPEGPATKWRDASAAFPQKEQVCESFPNLLIIFSVLA
jgi:hypothetical protein